MKGTLFQMSRFSSSIRESYTSAFFLTCINLQGLARDEELYYEIVIHIYIYMYINPLFLTKHQ